MSVELHKACMTPNYYEMYGRFMVSKAVMHCRYVARL